MELEQYQGGTAPLREAELALGVERAETELTEADELVVRMPALLAEGFDRVRGERFRARCS